MMNDIPNNLYTFRQRIDQSKQSSEVIKLIQEITRESVAEGERLILEYLLPYLVHDGDAPVSILSAISRLRECLVTWFDQYPEPKRYALRERVLDQLLLRLQNE